ncbi:MAG: transcription antitermination factor NusB [Alphaproteobacteria bacterium]|nr:transcription antitermination factor NusB [Alphaproteobacteria bacterium]
MNTPEPQRSKRRTDGRSRSASRLAVVQALYQMELADQDCETALREFIAHRLGQEIEGDQYAEADEKYFSDLVRGVVAKQAEIDKAIAGYLVKDWPFDRIDPTMRAIMRAATFELIARPLVPARVVVHEYMNVAAAFFEEGEEMAFLGGLLNRLARELRSVEQSPVPLPEQ